MKTLLLLLFLFIYNFQEVLLKTKKTRCRRGYGASEPILIVISFDGFKTEYLNSSYKILTEKFEEGVKTEFKTLRFANAFNVHQTIATGYFPNKHGVFAANWSNNENIIRTYERLQYENYLSMKNKILPIWTLNDQNGGTSACMMWPGCEHRYGPDNEMSLFQHTYNQTEDYTSRLTKVIEWMNESITLNPPNLIMIYFEQPDKLAHVYGPNASNLDAEIKKLDNFVENLYKKLKLLKLSERVDIVFLSDHRVTEIRYKDILDLRNMGVCDDVGLWGSDVWLQQQYFSRTAAKENTSKVNGEFEYVPGGCNAYHHQYYNWPCWLPRYPKSKCMRTIYEVQQFRSIKLPKHKKTDNITNQYYTYEMICPTSMHRGDYDEIPTELIANYTMIVASTNSSPTILVMNYVGFKLTYAAYGEMLYPKIKNWSAHYKFEVEECTKFGVHGYNYPETGFFLALGPSFVKNRTVKKFECQDLYSLFAKVLKIKGKFDNAGNFSRVKPVLNPTLLEVKKKEVNWLRIKFRTLYFLCKFKLFSELFVLIFICSIIHCIIFLIAVEIYLARKRRYINRRNRRRRKRRNN